ncbi:carbohydrate ABC transporter membrane protein 1, CUT1 family [Clostridium sp. USBA 49]|jgi:multiple sugar transport system permease protein|uniref:carbohydrate ABC transporter permease n=1 Tax=Clostridium sp. USBA 49 TaxID=1881060 RepID=UPI00099954E1|nr:sugar ABC transporter permease [Clostridium sp. USBA 49]SKA87832.1 carbohydrate ABC transporter membrane protein 1, CUT1 family [Clostridium sp. USBA 49]
MKSLKNILNKKSHWILLSPYIIMFSIFIIIPVGAAIALSFTYFNTIEFPSFIGLKNYIKLLTQDTVFMQKVLPNTIKYSLIVGPLGYILSFLLAWILAQLTKVPRTILAIIIYSPSMTAGVIMSTVWGVIFSGDQLGYLNSILINAGIISEPIQWLQSPQYLMTIMIIVSLWSSMGVGFLSMLSGVLNVNQELYEAAYIDGVRNRFQEIIYVTIPSMRPQMLFGAVMAVVNTFSTGGIGVALSGSNPTPDYAGQVIVNHIEDYGFIRYEMGYAAAVSVILLLMIWGASKVSNKLFADD